MTAHGWTLQSGGGFNDPSLGGGNLTMLWSGTTSNQLNGLQGVLDGSIFERGRFALDGKLRASLFLNRAHGTIVEQYSQTGGSVYGRTFTDESDRASFAANVGLSSSIRLAERFYFRTGYEVMFVTNVGMAPSQQQGVFTMASATRRTRCRPATRSSCKDCGPALNISGRSAGSPLVPLQLHTNSAIGAPRVSGIGRPRGSGNSAV